MKLSLQDFLHSASGGLLKLQPLTKATRLPFNSTSSWPQPIGPPLPLPLCLRPSEGSASSPQLRGLPATCPLPIPHAKRDRGGRRPRAPIPAPHRGDRQQLLYPGLLRLPGMHFQAPSYLGAAAPGSERPEETGSLGQS